MFISPYRTYRSDMSNPKYCHFRQAFIEMLLVAQYLSYHGFIPRKGFNERKIIYQLYILSISHVKHLDFIHATGLKCTHTESMALEGLHGVLKKHKACIKTKQSQQTSLFLSPFLFCGICNLHPILLFELQELTCLYKLTIK